MLRAPTTSAASVTDGCRSTRRIIVVVGSSLFRTLGRLGSGPDLRQHHGAMDQANRAHNAGDQDSVAKGEPRHLVTHAAVLCLQRAVDSLVCRNPGRPIVARLEMTALRGAWLSLRPFRAIV
jgi:hypothetical protein